MISFNNACKKAVKYFFEKYGEIELAKALETKEAWIFYSGKENKNKVGNMGILLFKENGNIEDFILPSKRNFKLLKEAIPIEINRDFLSNE